MRLPKLPFDPEQLPIDCIAGEGPVAPERLTADWLRSHFAAPPLWQPEALDESVGRRPVMIPAAVLIPLVARPDGLTMLLTQRTAHLNTHAGQISFPGGRAEDYDASPVDTALREAQEEIGLDRRHVEIIGTHARLPDRHRLPRHAGGRPADAAVRAGGRPATKWPRSSKCRWPT